MTVTELSEGQSITPGDELRATMTFEDETVFASIGGHRVTFSNLVPEALGLEEGDSMGVRFTVRKPIYEKSGRLETIFVDNAVEAAEAVPSRDDGTDTRAENEASGTESVSQQRVGQSRKRPQSRTNPNMMRDLVQGKL
ncbi:hypothetical protein [Natronorubrum sp. DTA7]|uniref:hypothetical protein n=1 Tax=Natronorubrum sp. DTA7 TaxID=3447016 RepID=UPI003F848215